MGTDENANYTLYINSKNGIELSFQLISHFTTIYGINSGEGKSWLFDLLVQMSAANELEVICESNQGKFYEVQLASLGSFKGLLEQEDRKVIIVDEIFIHKSSDILK